MSTQIRNLFCFLAFLTLPWGSLFAEIQMAVGTKHIRDCSLLSESEREFAEKLTAQNRRFFCGRFNRDQRQKAMHYTEVGIALTQSNTYLLAPDESVQRVREESGMSMAVKRQRECEDE